MSEPTTIPTPAAPKEMPPLRDGERLDQPTFHQRYEAMPPGTRAELIGGVVYMPSPLKASHGKIHGELMAWLKGYKARTPGTRVFDNATTILGAEGEPQPDASLCLLPECGGQTHIDEQDYLRGAPELVAEVSHSSEDIDLGQKLLDYQQAGVREYLVVLLRRQQVRWFVRRGTEFMDLLPGPDGFFRSEVFPGLWLDPQALMKTDTLRLLEILNQGLATPEHAAFVARLRRP